MFNRFPHFPPQIPDGLSAISLEPIAAGSPIYLNENGFSGIARSDDAAKTNVLGIAIASCGIAEYCQYQSDGLVEVENWGLVPGKTYFLGEGAITVMPPSQGFYVEIGKAQSSKSLEVEISTPIKL